MNFGDKTTVAIVGDKSLTLNDLKIYTCIKSFIEDFGCNNPSLRMIGNRCSIKDRSTVSKSVCNLVKKGYILKKKQTDDDVGNLPNIYAIPAAPLTIKGNLNE